MSTLILKHKGWGVHQTVIEKRIADFCNALGNNVKQENISWQRDKEFDFEVIVTGMDQSQFKHAEQVWKQI